MAEADQNPPKQQDAAADALDYLAVGEKDFAPPQEQTSLSIDPAEAAAAAAVDADPLAALTRMDQEPSEQAPAAPATPPPLPGSEPATSMAASLGMTIAEAARAKLNRPATLAKAQQRVTLQSYKTTMIPMLVVVGGLVAIVAMLSLIMLITGNAGEMPIMGVQVRHWFLLMTLLGFPLSGATIFGAYWFHRELKSVK